MENLFRDEQKKVKKRKKVAKSTLSFAVDDEGDGADTPSSRGEDGDGDDEKPAKRPKSRKNPNVDTSFLPDREREEEERRQREELRQEWLRKQEEMKKEEIEITYSYWDGSGHRKSVTVRSGSCPITPRSRISLLQCQRVPAPQCKKGDDIAGFLEKCRQQCPELRGVSVDNLMYVKVSALLHPLQPPDSNHLPTHRKI